MRLRSRRARPSSRLRPTPRLPAGSGETLVGLLVVAGLAGCSGNGDVADGPSEQADRPAAPRQEHTSSSSTPTSPPLEPVVPITPAEPPASTTPGPPTGPLIATATWSRSAYGPTLKIAPTDAGRAASDPTDARTAWREVLAMTPDADTPGMWAQFECHWTWARLVEPGKPTWNVEPWRPVVDEGRMISERCNPGGPEV